jgi:hypothetical protein
MRLKSKDSRNQGFHLYSRNPAPVYRHGMVINSDLFSGESIEEVNAELDNLDREEMALFLRGGRDL